jgi:tetratricopeptide (TPR) repeat protein
MMRPVRQLLLILQGDEKRVRSLVAVTMAFITLFATSVAFWQQDASINAEVAERTASQAGTMGVGRDLAAMNTTTSNFGDFRRWYEHLEAANWASDLALDGGSLNLDPELLNAMTTLETELSAWVQARSDLLQPPYFDEQTYLTDFAGYIAEHEVAPRTRTALIEQSQLALANEYDGRGTVFITILTLLAVSLFFLGLATTLSARSRPLFVLTGVAFVIAALGWTGMTVASPPQPISEGAIESIVSARTELAQVENQGGSVLSESDRAHLDKALASAEAAVASQPAWGPALTVSAETRTFYGDLLFFASTGADERGQELLAQAVADYQLLLEQEADDYSTWWNMGWAQLLIGDNEDSLASTQRAIALAPDQFALLFNRALAQARAGDDQGALESAQQALEIAAAQTLDSSSYFFTQADRNLALLADIWPEQQEILDQLLRLLREGKVSLTALQSPIPQGEAVELENTALVKVSLDAQGNFVPEHFDSEYEFSSGDSFAATDINGVRLFVLGDGVVDGDVISVRVWINGAADYSSALDTVWEPLEGNYMAFDIISPYGQADFDVDPGDYQLELYVNGHTATAMSWTVTAP